MRLNQITLGSTDFTASVAFYCTLGLRLIVSSREEYARFDLPDCEATLSLHRQDAVPPEGPVIYFEVEDVDQTVKDLHAKGITFDSEPQDQPWPWREARFVDPSGNRLCIYHAGVNRRDPPWRLHEENCAPDADTPGATRSVD